MMQVSIVLPTLNGSRYLREAVDSCLAQTHPYIELIVVDGGSSDDTLAILEEYRDSRLAVLRQEGNEGRLPGALNMGFARASGGLLTWMQDDCRYDPRAIETLVAYLDGHRDVDFVYGDYWIIDDRGQRSELVRVGPPEDLLDHDCVGLYHLWRRSVYETIGGFDTAAFLAEDYEYWLRVRRQFRMVPVHFSNSALFEYRVHDRSLTAMGYTIYRRVRIGARYKRRLHGMSLSMYRRQMAWAFVGEAFLSRERGDRANLLRCLAGGLLYDPQWVRNRGLISIGIEGAVGRGAMARWRAMRLKNGCR